MSRDESPLFLPVWNGDPVNEGALMHYIYNVDHEASGAHHWRVRIRRCAHVYRSTFNDQRYGGREEALCAAQVYRDQLLQSLPPLTMTMSRARPRKNNRSGVSGVRHVDRVEVVHGRRQRKVFWEAKWSIGTGRSRTQKFSVLKYGEESAVQMALAARENALQALSAQTLSPFPNFAIAEKEARRQSISAYQVGWASA